MIEVFIVNEDTIPDISKASGLSEAVLMDMLEYDRGFGLTTKLYLVPGPALVPRDNEKEHASWCMINKGCNC